MNNPTKAIVGVIVAILVVLGLLSFADTEKASVEDVKIGIMLPLSGDLANLGEDFQKAVLLASEDADIDEGQVIFEDSRCDSAAGISAVTKLTTVDNVVGIVGALCSSVTLPSSTIATEQQVPMVSPASTSPALSDAGPYTFRTVPSDALQGAFAANLIYDRGFRKVAIAYTNEDYGVGYANVLRETFTELGGEVAAEENFTSGVTDLRTQVSRIKAANPDIVYVMSNSSASSVAVLRQLSEQGVEAPIYGAESLGISDVTEGAQEAAEGLIVSTVSAGNTDFITRFNDEFGKEPGPFAAQAYDAFTAIAQTIKDGATTGPEVRDALAELSFTGVSGNIDFDENGDVAGNYRILVVQDGEFVPETN